MNQDKSKRIYLWHNVTEKKIEVRLFLYFFFQFKQIDLSEYIYYKNCKVLNFVWIIFFICDVEFEI